MRICAVIDPRVITFALGLTLFGTAAGPVAAGQTARYDFASKPAEVYELPSPLREVSGLVLSPDGRLMAHNDERGTVYEIDRHTGRMVKQFAVGEWRLREDLEGIAAVAGTLRAGGGKPPGAPVRYYFVNSGGDLFAFGEGDDRTHVAFTRTRTGLGARNNVEGLCHDPATGTLLLACKGYPGKDLGKTRAVYAFSLAENRLLPSPRFLIRLKELKDRFGLKDFQPSGIARHPGTGNFFVISAGGNSIIEISPDGRVLSCGHLNKRYNEQPEGIEIAADGTLYIANEGRRKGSISVYAPVEKGGPDGH